LGRRHSAAARKPVPSPQDAFRQSQRAAKEELIRELEIRALPTHSTKLRAGSAQDEGGMSKFFDE